MIVVTISSEIDNKTDSEINNKKVSEIDRKGWLLYMNTVDAEVLFRWEGVSGGVRITGCTGDFSVLEVPGVIDGLPVVEIGNYAFRGKEMLREVFLPESLERLGDHVFFNCLHLEKLTVYDTLNYVGDGAFKNCDHLTHMVMHVRRDRASALRRLLSDVMQDVRVDIFYEEDQHTEPVHHVRLMFPAFFFDYVENYPARIFEEVIYGAGQAYRQCFRGGDVDYDAYDRLFERSGREDHVNAVLEHAVGRLTCPYRLKEERKIVYENWLAGHGPELLKKCMAAELPEDLEQVLSLDLYDEEQTKQMIDKALQERKVEFVNLLMAYQGRRFAGKGKRRKYAL